MKLKFETKIVIGVSCTALVGEIAMLVEASIIGKYAKQLGYSATATYVTVGIAFLIVFIASLLSSRYIGKVLKMHLYNLKNYTDRIAKGETEFDVKAPADDEFNEVYDSLQTMVLVNREEALVADSIAKGDLTVEVKAKSDHDLLGMALAGLVKSNNEVLSGIHDSSYQLTTGAEQVAAASQTLAQGSTEQASAIEQVTVSMKEIEEMTNLNAEQSNQAQEIVKTTKNEAEAGNKCMADMKKAMDEINDSSEKIGKIIKVIDDISFQTNILALNAAVEAARAGSHGKGFAVVAEQIRELAGKSAAAAAETADMIDDSIRKVHKGTKLADDTSKALSSMMDNIERVVAITASITKASNEQAAAVAQIDQAIEQVSQVVQNNSATSEECAAAAEELSGQSMSLRQMIDRYKLAGVDADNMLTLSSARSTYKAVDSFADKKTDPESIISLDGGFGKY